MQKVALTAAVVLLCGCTQSSKTSDKEASGPSPTPPSAKEGQEEKQTAPPVEKHWFRAEISTDLGPIPFFLQLPPEGPGKVKNGEELIEVEHSWKGDKLKIVFPLSGNTIEAQRTPNGSLEGQWSSISFKDVEGEFIAAPMTEEPQPLDRFEGKVARRGRPDLSGTWEFQFADHGHGKGILQQTDTGVVTGSIIVEGGGDLRYLVGQHGREFLELSTFDGAHAYLVRAKLLEDGTLEGTWAYPELWYDDFTAKKVESVSNFELNRASLKKGKQGVSLAALKAMKGKPVVLDLFGTWCPACLDSTPFLVEMHKKYSKQGIQFLSVAYELAEDSEENKKRVANYASEFGVEWPIEIVHVTDGDLLGAIPAEIQSSGFPILVLIDAKGQVRQLQTGFVSDALANESQEHEAMLDKQIAALLK
jgi:thiol-disulfide isomerase/thioredoxin